MIFTILLVVVAILFLCHVCIRFSRTGRMIDRIPGPYAYPILGNSLMMQGNQAMLFKMFEEFSKLYYPIYRFWGTVVPIVNICHPDDAEILLTSTIHIDKGMIYKYVKPWLSTGLLTSCGAKCQKRRKIITPAFRFNILTQFVDVMIEESQYLVESLKKKGDGKAVVTDVMDLMGEHTLNTICETAMGISLKGKNNLQNEYRDSVKVAGESMTYRCVRPWYYFDFIFGLSSVGRAQKKALKILHAFTDSIIAERKRYHESTGNRYLHNLDTVKEKSKADEEDDFDITSIRKRRLAMLDLLIAASHDNLIDDIGIREEVDTVTFGGHDTTAMAVSYALLLLAKNKDAQERAREEVNEVMLGNDKLTIPVLKQLTYLERCIKESLRIYPSVPYMARRLQQDCQLTKYTIPSGTTTVIHIFDIHRDPAFWPNPLVFDPDRFLPENIKGRHPYSFVPFSAGPRQCIGQIFAMIEMKLMMAYILHNFALEPVDEIDDIEFKTDLILRPSQPIRMKFVPLH